MHNHVKPPFSSCRPPLARRLLLLPLLAVALGAAGCTAAGSTRKGEAAATAPASASAPASGSATAPAAPAPAPAPSAASGPAQSLLSRMTLEEKVGQMLLAGIEGTALDAKAQAMIAGDKVGGIILYGPNISDLPGLVTLVNSLKQTNAGNPAPLFISVDQEGGKVSRLPKEFAALPPNGTVGLKKEPKLAGEMGKLLARELRAAGFNMNFAPVLDVNSNPANPVIGERSFGSSPGLVSKLGLAEMQGLRSEGVIPVVKHFPGHGDTSVDSHLDLPVVRKTADQLRKTELPPFEAAVKEQAEAVMVAHILFPELDPDMPASLSEIAVGGLLRQQLGFQGVVITDDLGMGAVAKRFDLGEAAIRAVRAGCDILLVAHGYDKEKLVYDTLLQSVKQGRIAESRIDESVRRILALKQMYRLTDRPVPVPDVTRLNEDIRTWKSRLQQTRRSEASP